MNGISRVFGNGKYLHDRFRIYFNGENRLRRYSRQVVLDNFDLSFLAEGVNTGTGDIFYLVESVDGLMKAKKISLGLSRYWNIKRVEPAAMNIF